MIATHTMKINGVLYRAGEVIPSPDDKPVSKAVNEDKEVIADTEVENVDEKPYKKSDIMTMKTADLRSIAAENGIESPDELTGTELKKILIEKFGL